MRAVEEDKALEEIFSQKHLPGSYRMLKKRWKEGTLGVKSKIKLLEDQGYEVDPRIKKS